MITVDPEKLALFERITLDKGSHIPRVDEPAMCAMEMVAYLANETWSDHPACACPVITSFVIAWNDALSDEERNRLIKPRVPSLIGTRSDLRIQEARAFMALDWYLREMTPAWLELVESLTGHAAALRAAAPVVDLETAKAIAPLSRSAQQDAAAAWDAAWDAAWAAAGAAAGDAAWDAAWDAAGDAAGAAAWDAAWDAAWAAAGAAARAAAGAAARAAARAAAWAAAGDAAGDAAGAAAGDAAWDAAGDAAGAKLRPTVERIQASAAELLDRMIALR